MLTFALTHYERYEMLVEAVSEVLDDPRIDEIVISDDCSLDGSWEKLLQHFLIAGGRVNLFRNSRNIDCYANKRAAVARATYPWVVLFDSDNILPTSYLDALDAVRPLDDHTAYLPVFAEPEFDYTAFAGQRIDRHNVAEFVDVGNFTTALNTANYVVNRAEYIRAWDDMADPRTSDSLYMNYRWLLAGNTLEFVPGMTYKHRMHDGSHFVKNYTPRDATLARDIIRNLRGLR